MPRLPIKLHQTRYDYKPYLLYIYRTTLSLQNHMSLPGSAALPYLPLALSRWHQIRACVWLVDSICRYVMLCHRMPAIIYAKLPQWSHAKLHIPWKYWVSSGLAAPLSLSLPFINFPLHCYAKFPTITYQWLTSGGNIGEVIDFYVEIYAAITNHLGPLLTGPHHLDTSLCVCVCVLRVKLTYP